MERQRISSSNIRAIGYQNSTLEVEFNNGKIYQYYNVPENIYHGLMNASSHGTYLASNIINRFRYKEL